VYLGNDDGSAATNFYFQGVTSGSTTMLAEIACLALKISTSVHSQRVRPPPTHLPADFWIGEEDVKFANGADPDYNDMIINLRVVPEPRYYFVLAATLLGVALIQRRMKRGSVS
jgi:hypothetical protein